MNKYQEALGFLKESACENYLRQHVQTHEERVTIFKSSKYLQELVDKATPKAPNGKHSGWRSPDGVSVLTFFEYSCPHCERRVTDIDNFCPNCGQAIDWGKQ